MMNDGWRKTSEIRSPNYYQAEAMRVCKPADSFGFRISDFLRISSFVIRHLPIGFVIRISDLWPRRRTSTLGCATPTTSAARGPSAGHAYQASWADGARCRV